MVKLFCFVCILFLGSVKPQCIKNSMSENTCDFNYFDSNTSIIARGFKTDNPEKTVKNIAIATLLTKSFPKNIGEKFPNLIWLHISRGNLLNLTSDDLKQFPNLEILIINDCPRLNELKDSSLFMHNKKLKMIGLRKLNLNIIDYRIFLGLKNLQIINLQENKCIDEIYFEEKGHFEYLKDHLESKCMGGNSTYCNSDTNENCECTISSPDREIQEFIKECKTENLQKVSISGSLHSNFPKFSENFQFLSLVDVSVRDGQMSWIQSKDFKPIPNVKELDLSNNKIEKLDSDVFEYTLNLDIFKIVNNKLQSIGIMAFSRLSNLEYVDFKGNLFCTSHGTIHQKELHMLRSNKIKDSCKKRDILTECLFIKEEFLYVGTAFTCIATNVNITSYLLKKLWKINGFENSPRPFEVLFIKDQTCNFMPDVHSIYIKAIHVVNSKLQALSKYDFLGVPNLRSFVVSSNLIQNLDFSIFTNNLLHLDFRSNDLKTIESVDLIKKSALQSVLLEGNICVDENFEDDLSSLQEIADGCRPTKKVLPIENSVLFKKIFGLV